MTRRTKSSPAEGMMDLVALLPWWAGVALAFVAYIVLHNIAGREVVANTTPGQINTSVMPTMLNAVAGLGQYIGSRSHVGQS